MDDFDDFFDEHYARVVRSLVLACGAPVDAEDAAQDAFAKALVRWNTVARMERPATWVYVVAVRDLRRRLRRHGIGDALDGTRLATANSTNDPADAVIAAAVVGDALATLAPRQRLAIVLRFHADLAVRDIARAMHCTEGTVKATLHTALAHLRADLTERDLEGARDGTGRAS
jgi:RNA polymerase sigma factor (sigma-70 family)